VANECNVVKVGPNLGLMSQLVSELGVMVGTILRKKRGQI
jgi:hypothetical protein